MVRVLDLLFVLEDEVHWEKPESQIDPRGDHEHVRCYLCLCVGDVDCHLEYSYGHIGDIVYDHDDSTNWHVIETVRDQDEGQSQGVVDEILWEISSLPVTQ